MGALIVACPFMTYELAKREKPGDLKRIAGLYLIFVGSLG